MPNCETPELTERSELLLLRLTALRPDLVQAAELIVYEHRSPGWVKRHCGERTWEELAEFVTQNLWTQWGF